MAKQGADKPRAPERRTPAPQKDGARDRVGPRQYLSEVKGELKKVAWPTRREVLNSSLVVLIAIVVMTAVIFGFDYVSGKFVLFLFD